MILGFLAAILIGGVAIVAWLASDRARASQIAEVHTEVFEISSGVTQALWEHRDDPEYTVATSMDAFAQRRGEQFRGPSFVAAPYLLNPSAAAWIDPADDSPIVVVSPVQTGTPETPSGLAYIAQNAKGGFVYLSELPDWARPR